MGVARGKQLSGSVCFLRLDGTRQSGSKHHRVEQIDHSTSTRGGLQSVECKDHVPKELAVREPAAWRGFCASRQLLCDNNVALKYRLRLLTSCVVPSMYWCAGSWILSSTQCTRLRAVQDRMQRKMITYQDAPRKALNHT